MRLMFSGILHIFSSMCIYEIIDFYIYISMLVYSINQIIIQLFSKINYITGRRTQHVVSKRNTLNISTYIKVVWR